jgi:hypothetical protein
MSTPQETAAADGPGERDGMSDRTARAILTVVALGAMWGIVAVLPETAYVIVGVLCTHGWQQARRWLTQRRSDPADEDQAQDDDREPLAETMHRLADPHVFLADLADARGLSMDVTRALLEALGIRVRRAVRCGTRTGVGVHKDDLPPLPRPDDTPPVAGVDLQQQHNQQGSVRVERTEGGLIIYDLSETNRRHTVT